MEDQDLKTKESAIQTMKIIIIHHGKMADSRLEMIFNGLNAQYLHPILREQIEDVYTFILKH